MNDCKEIEGLLQGYLDKELAQFESQLVENHVAECGKCREALEGFRTIKQEVGRMRFQTPTQEAWDQARPPVAVKATRGIGWILLIAGSLVLTAFGMYEFAVDPAVQAMEKITILAFTLGISFLFISVLYERIRASKTDKYKGVEK